MADDDQRIGLDIPKYVYRYGEVAGSEARAAPLNLLNDAGELLNDQALLLEMLAEVRRLEALGNNNQSRSEELNLCADLVERLLSLSGSPLSTSTPLASLLLGYLYRGLTSPSEDRHEAISMEAIRLLKTESRRGMSQTKEVQRQGAKWMQDKAVEIWRKDYAKKRLMTDVAEEVLALARQEAERRQAAGDISPIACWAMGIRTIKGHLKKVAPDYASKRGRPSNT